MTYFLLPTTYSLLTCAFAYLCWRRIDLAIALTVFALPAYLIRFSLWGVPMTVLEAMIVVMFLVWGVKKRDLRDLLHDLLMRWKKISVATAEESATGGGREAQVKSQKSKVQSQNAVFFLSEYKWLIGLLLIAATVSVFVSSDRLAALGIWKAYFVEPILFFIVLVNVFQNKTNCRSAEINSYQLPSIPKFGAARPPQISWIPLRGTVLSSTSINFYQLFTALGLSALAVAIPAVVQKFTAWGIANPFWAAEETRRVVSWYGFPNAVGLYLAPMVVWFAGGLVYWWRQERGEIGEQEGKGKREKGKGLVAIQSGEKDVEEVVAVEAQKNMRQRFIVFLFFCFFVFLPILAILWARSEGAMVGVAAGAVALVFGLAGGRARWGIGLIGLICLIGLISYAPARSLIVEKATFSDLSGQIRVQQWKETWNMLKDNRLIFGAGLAGYRTAIKPYHQEGIFFNFDNDPNFRNNLVFGDAEYKAAHWQPTEIYLYPHNFLLNFWSETGLLGLLAILGILIKFFLDYLRTDAARRPLYLVLISVMIAVVVHGMVDVQYFKNDLSVLFWLIIGCAVIIQNRMGRNMGQEENV